jgi:hypothetical protein
MSVLAVILEKEKDINKFRKSSTFLFLNRCDTSFDYVLNFKDACVNLLKNQYDSVFIRLPSLKSLLFAIFVLFFTQKKIVVHVAAIPVKLYRLKRVLLNLVSSSTRVETLITGVHIGKELNLDGVNFVDTLNDITINRLHPKTDAINVLVVGREGKKIQNLDFFIDWLNREKINVSKVTSVGAYLPNIYPQLHIDNIGKMPHEELMNMMESHGILYFGSTEKYEGIPRIIIEALSKGLMVFHNNQKCIVNFNDCIGLIDATVTNHDLFKLDKVVISSDLCFAYNKHVLELALINE